jgi:hypothetical protein
MQDQTHLKAYSATAVKSFIELALEKAVTHCSQKKEIEQCTIKKNFIT